MGVATGAVHLIAHHAVARIGRFLHVISHVVEIAGPTRAAVKFGAAVKQFSSAANTHVDAIGLRVPICTAESALGAMLPRYSILFLGQFALPIIVATDYLLRVLRLQSRT